MTKNDPVNSQNLLRLPQQTNRQLQGVLLINKPRGRSSFSLVSLLRKILNIKKIGHAGTLDPAATGLMVMLIGKAYTVRSNEFLCDNKEYIAEIHLGITTDTYDSEGVVITRSEEVPSYEQLEEAISRFQGEISQTPPMFSAKKINGQRLYRLARQGREVPRLPSQVNVKVTLLEYAYPFIKAHISCSKGTYIRSLAHDLGQALCTGAHLSQLQRVRSGNFDLKDSIGLDGLTLQQVTDHLLEI